MGTATVPSVSRSPAVRPRRGYLDNLKVVLVAGVIAGHVLITYADLGSWAYREPSDNDAFLVPAALFVALGSLFAMGLFFLIAGLLTPHALERKGAGRFLRDRVLRLGVPFLLFLLLVYPLVEWAGERSGRSPWWYLQAQLVDLDPGPLWFVLALLLFSTAYTAWRGLRPASPVRRPLTPRYLVVLVVAMAVSTFLVRLWFPIDSAQVFALHVWQWPQCIGLYVLGLAAAERDWLDPVPRRTRRVGGLMALTGLAAVVVAFAVSRDSLDPFAGGVSWQSVLVAASEAIVAVGLALWLLGLFQRRYDATGPWSRALGRAAFGAYILQAPVVVTIALLAAPVPVPPEIKALVVAPASIAASFGLAWLLTRIPGVNRLV